ncbi:DUF262 domain-containing protein [Echinicola sp. CAU 1574]|uniref:DUF262 domain-containing protein n=1 Tax=Echinicola arenosa TaxID=2774144 RepID=A0ABR9AMU2_9BACT|nr:DUF262 domain-containing protein [Echinicola arenosa]MBD8489183.1 DUF262 domain-containing protein [Echinicola arenosa]
MAISSGLTIQGTHVQTIYTDFIKQRLLVNRNYQRKLVWTIEEKRNFIDTLSRELPIPLFLLAEVNFESSTKLEIIDGMQRFDAIFSFIENKYSLKDGFFDLSVMSDSQSRLENGVLKQKEPKLDKEFCRKIVNYLLPISKASTLTGPKIEETFRRINSNGKHLSNQELRHAGTLGKFPTLVRKLATDIRKDISDDLLVLNEMSKISITQKRLGYYGVSVLDMFWVKHHIVSPDNIRNSTDEEIIAFLLADMISANDIHMTAARLDKYYGYNPNPLAVESKELEEIETSLSRVSDEIISKNFRRVFATIENLLIEARKDFPNLLFVKSKGSSIREVYHILFMTFYQLIIKENKSINDSKALIKSMSGMGDDLFSKNQLREAFKGKERRNIINHVIGRIQEHFRERNSGDPINEDWTLEFEKILMNSITEQNQIDFKMGVTTLTNGKYNSDLVTKIAKTLSAISNLGPNKAGYVIVGVADNENDANQHKAHYNRKHFIMNKFRVTGIEPEALKYYNSVDKYLRRIKDTIKSAPLKPDRYKNEILSNIISRQYHGKEVLIFKAIPTNEPVWFDGALFERHMSHNNKVEPENHSAIYSRFFKRD